MISVVVENSTSEFYYVSDICHLFTICMAGSVLLRAISDLPSAAQMSFSHASQTDEMGSNILSNIHPFVESHLLLYIF